MDKEEQMIGIKINLVKEYIKVNKTIQNVRIKFISNQ